MAILSKIFLLGQLICIYIIFNTTDINKIMICAALNYVFALLGICSGHIADAQQEQMKRAEEFQKLAETWLILKMN